MPDKNLGGRPKVSPQDYNENWKEEVLAHYKDGNSDVSVRVSCFGDHTVSSELWYRWIEEEDGFSATIKKGKEISLQWWEGVSKDHACGKNTDANATSLIFNMCNRFRDRYQQRQVVEQTTALTMSVKEMGKLRDELEELGIDTSKL